ncbi:MAG: Hpt domain-containing protein [SAR324 cluster bacterium]|nr:Hpt domain-containing protein [SAR324 cluster bacterium]
MYISFSTFSAQAQYQPEAVAGVLDLRGWDFERQRVVKLNGQWELFWNQRLGHDESHREMPLRTGFFRVPGSWNKYVLESGQAIGSEGLGTFRLQVLLPAGSERMAFKIPDQGTAYELWMNGQRIASAGTVGTSRQNASPQFYPQIFTFTPRSQILELVLVISNYHTQAGGPWYSILLGRDDQIQTIHKKGIAVDLFLVGSLLIMGMYHLGLFSLRPKDRSTLYFGIFCILIACRTLVVGERLFQTSLPWMPWEVGRKMEYLSFYISGPMITLFMAQLFPHEFNKKIDSLLVGIATVFVLIVLLTFSHIYTYTLFYYQVFSLFWVVYSFQAISRAVIHKREGSLVFIFGWFLLAGGITNDILTSMELLQTPLLMSFALFGFIFIQAFLLSIRFSKAFLTSERLLVENQRLVRDLQKLNEHLEEMVDQRTEQLLGKTRDIQTMLENLPEGILMITDDYEIHHEYSQYLETILETSDLAYGNIRTILFENSSLGADDVHRVETAIIACLCEDLRNYHINEHLFIHELSKTFPGNRTKHLELTWAPIINQDDEIDKILLSIRDVTILRSLQKQADQHQRELQMIGQILALPLPDFQNFLVSSFWFLEENEQIIRANESPSAELLETLFRNMHTIKGNARTYGFDHVTHMIHETEQEYDELRKHPEQEWNRESLLEKIRVAHGLIQDYARLNDEKLGRKSGEDSVELMVREQDIARVNQTLENLDRGNPQQVETAIRSVRSFLSRIMAISLKRILQSGIRSLESLARELEKATPDVVILDHDLVLRKQAGALLQNVFMHLLRNSMDHGIESPEERTALGKPRTGTIRIEMRRNQDHLEIVCQDDGRGLALEKIWNKAVENGLVVSHQQLSLQSVADLVFLSGLSTQKTVTEISGRGVGMDAVRKFLKEHHGDIRIQLLSDTPAPYIPFQFVLSLPLSFCVD